MKNLCNQKVNVYPQMELGKLNQPEISGVRGGNLSLALPLSLGFFAISL